MYYGTLRMHNKTISTRDPMTTLVVGATGATGRLLVNQLLDRGVYVKAIVRSPDRRPASVSNHPNLSVVRATVLDLSETDLIHHVSGCDAIASCLGHTLNLKGIYGHPRRLVTDTLRRLCSAVKAAKPVKPVRVVLMNTTGNSNRDIPEKRSFGERLVIGMVRLLLPPQVDNEEAADYLRTTIGRNDALIQWTVVRPDTLINTNEVTKYDFYPSPIRSPIFDAGTTSRINVADFMADLITDDRVWERWKGQMPVIYNKEPLEN